MDKKIVSQVSSSIESTIASIPSSHIPIYQSLSHSIKPTNTKISNGFNAESQPNHSNPFQQNKLIDNEPITSNIHHHRLNEIAIKSTPPPIAISSPSFVQQFSPNVSQTSSMCERDRITESSLPMMPNFMRNQLQPSMRSSVLAPKSPPLMEPSVCIPNNDEFTPRIGNSNYDYPQTDISIATSEHQRIEHPRQSVSPQMIQFQEIQEIEERMVDQLNELYKATMLINSNQRESSQRREHDEIEQINKSYLQHDSNFNSGELTQNSL